MADFDDTNTVPSSRLLRSFSDDFREQNPGDSLGRGLAAKVAIDKHRESHARQQWNTLLQDAQEMVIENALDDDAVLLEQSRRLYAVWHKFQAALPKDQRQELNPNEKPDIRYLINSVTKAAMTWKEDRDRTKSGRLKQTFSNICNNCRDHSNLLSIVPSNDKYLCLLTGSISAIAQASVNHQEIASAVAESLEELSQNIQFWNRQMNVHGDVQVMWRYIRELYVVVFEFLTEIFTQWSRSPIKRFLTSFDENAFKKLFSQRRARIQAIERRMESEATLDFQRKVNAKLQKLADDQQLLIEMNQRMLTQPGVVGLTLQNQRTLLGASLQQFLEEQTRILQYQLPLSVTQPLQLTGVDAIGESLAINDPTPNTPGVPESTLEADPDQLFPPSSQDFNKEELIASMAVLVARLKQHTRQVIDLNDLANHLQLDAQVQLRLLAWIKNPNSDKIWIQGPHDVNIPSQNTLTAVSLVSLSRKSEIPCIFYFGTFAPGGLHEKSHQLALKHFLTLVIIQLVLLLPAQVPCSLDFSLGRFAPLLKEDFTTDYALRVVRDLRTAIPSMIQFIFDDLQVLEDRSDQLNTRELLIALGTLCTLDDEEKADETDVRGEQQSSKPASTVTKICFTTAGYMDALGQAAGLNLIHKTEFSLESAEKMADSTLGIEL